MGAGSLFPQRLVLQRELVDHLGVGADEFFETCAVLLECEVVALQVGEGVVVVAELGCGSACVEGQLLEMVA